jgi:hypothetical protein
MAYIFIIPYVGGKERRGVHTVRLALDKKHKTLSEKNN